MEKILYTKYSNERVRQFAIRTDIRRTADGGRVVVKQACYPEGKEHVARLGRWDRELTALFDGTPFSVNRCVMDGECARLEYLEERTLEEHLDELLLAGREEEAVALLTGYAQQVRRALSGGRFVMTPEFVRVFGDAELSGELACAPLTDIDMVVGNVLETGIDSAHREEPDGAGGWTLLDYEWTFDFPVPADFVIYRALRYYLYGNQLRALLQERDIYAMAGVGRENQRAFEEMEEHFQAYVRGDVVILAKLYDEISPGYISNGTAAEKRAGARGANLRFEVFFDRGAGFSARDSYDILYGGGRDVRLSIPAGEDVRKIRLDPPVDHCIVWLKKASWVQGKKERQLHCTSNGKEIRPELILFDTEDAQIIFEGVRGAGELILELTLEQSGPESLLPEYFARPASGEGPAKELRTRVAGSAKKLKKTAAKGAAYIKKNGVISGVKRGLALMAKPEEYGSWLAARRMDERAIAQMEEVYRDTIADIRTIAIEDLSEPEEGCYYLFVEKSGKTEREAAAVYAEAIRKNPRAELFYCDSDRMNADGEPSDPCFKPDFDRYLLYSMNYIGAGFLVSGRLLARLGGRPKSGEAALYALLLACADEAEEIVHIPRVLYHAGAEEAEDLSTLRRGRAEEEKQARENFRSGAQGRGRAEAEKQALAAYFQQKGVRARVLDGARPDIRCIVWPLPEGEERPLVSVLIPNKDNARQLAVCLQSIEQFSGYDHLEILILENNSVQEETFALYRKLEREGRARILKWEGAFDFSRVNNFGAAQAKGDYLLFLNNDTRMCRKDCVRELLGYAAQRDVGAVGARMYYPDGSIQHAGVIVGYSGVAGHAFEGFEKERQEQTAWILAARQYSAVTAACMMVRKDLFLSLGGFCEELGVAYNDVDLCLRIRERGKKVIYNPYAELIHFESQTRGLEISREKAERVKKEAAFFCARWRDALESGDPCYNPNLTLERPDFSLARRG